MAAIIHPTLTGEVVGDFLAELAGEHRVEGCVGGFGQVGYGEFFGTARHGREKSDLLEIGGQLHAPSLDRS